MTMRTLLSMTGWLAFTAVTVGVTPGGRTDSFWEKVLKIVGISANPNNLKGRNPSPAGKVWMIDVERHTRHEVTKAGGYRSPVFEPGDRSLLALRGEDLVRVPLPGGEPVKLFTVADALKIVGFDRENKDEVMILTQNSGDAPLVVVLLSLKNGQRTQLKYDPNSDDQRLVNHLAGWDRVYGNTRLIVQRKKKETPQGEEELANIVLKQGDRKAETLTPDDEVDCLQPSLSWDHHRVLFIKKGG